MRQIRKGVFETNSSSTHAICINTQGELTMPPKEGKYNIKQRNRLDAQHKYDFGWEVEQYHDFDHKFDYLWHAIIDVYSCYDEIVGYKDEKKYWPIYKSYSTDERLKLIMSAYHKIKTWLSEEGYDTWLTLPIVNIYVDDGNEDVTSYRQAINVPKYEDNRFECHIDHGYEAREFVEGILSDKNIFMQYLFCEDSCICTGNDNDGVINYPDKSTYDLEYYKGN